MKKALFYGALTIAIGAILWEGASRVVSPLPVGQALYVAPAPWVTDREDVPLWVGLNDEDQVSIPISLDLMGKWLPTVLVEVEDRRFWSHKGVDWLGIIRATVQNVYRRRIVSGGSTLTSQLVRMTLPRERSFYAKLIEFLQAVQLERSSDKRSLLEAYLNKAPFGGNLQGVAAGALGWWGKRPSDLSLSEAALLVAMLKGPTRYRPDIYPERAKARRDGIIQGLVSRGIISPSQGALSMAEALPERISLPRDNFLFVSQVLSLWPEGGRSTLDRGIQANLSRKIHLGLRELPSDITASAVVVENSIGAIRGYIGNGRFGDPAPWEWVDCASSPRSPGSALKPFVFAMAMDDGLLSPSSLMADTPLSMAGRAPRNFDLRYRGPVSMAQALAQSLNVPAVRALRMVGVERFLHRLRNLGFKGLKEDGAHYGDSLILGGCEVSPLEMAQAYLTLASWCYRPLKFMEQEELESAQSPFSSESSYLTGSILTDRSRLPQEARRFLGERASMAFKTGTSYGLRDAWAIGWNEVWTVVVWMGDPTGASHPELVGLSAAVPMLVEVMAALGGSMPSAPDGVAQRTVCSLSGLPPNSACPHRTEAWFIDGVSPSSTCTLHRWIGGEVVTVLPAELDGLGEDKLPPFRIVSPLEGAVYVIPPWGEAPRVPLSVEGARGKVWWYVEGRFIGESEPSKPLFWTLSSGKHRIGALDRSGRSHWVRISASSWGSSK
nr:penicillin-binding protein 1C [uncultured Dethiosulfovibrio sp.]